MEFLKYLIITCGFIILTNSSTAQNISIYVNPNKSEKVKVQADTILYKYQYESILRELLMLRKKNEDLLQSEGLLKERIAQLTENDVDKFLNLQDTTIFGSKFQILSVRAIPKRSSDFYSLIQKIHDLNSLLTTIENMNISQLLSAGNQLTEARRLIDEINSYATLEKRKVTDFLSEEQKKYCRNLVKRYNTLNGSLNRNSQGMSNE